MKTAIRRRLQPSGEETGLWLYFSAPPYRLLQARFRHKKGDRLGNAELKTKLNPAGYTWGKVSRAFCLFFLDYLIHCQRDPGATKHMFSDPPRGKHSETVGQAQCLGRALVRPPEWMQTLIVSNEADISINTILMGDNREGHDSTRPITLRFTQDAIMRASQIRVYVDEQLVQSHSLKSLRDEIQKQVPDFINAAKAGRLDRNQPIEASSNIELPVTATRDDDKRFADAQAGVFKLKREIIAFITNPSRDASDPLSFDFMNNIAKILANSSREDYLHFFEENSDYEPAFAQIKTQISKLISFDENLENKLIKTIIPDGTGLEILYQQTHSLAHVIKHWSHTSLRKLDSQLKSVVFNNAMTVPEKFDKNFPTMVALLATCFKNKFEIAANCIIALCKKGNFKSVIKWINKDGLPVLHFCSLIATAPKLDALSVQEIKELHRFLIHQQFLLEAFDSEPVIDLLKTIAAPDLPRFIVSQLMTMNTARHNELSVPECTSLMADKLVNSAPDIANQFFQSALNYPGVLTNNVALAISRNVDRRRRWVQKIVQSQADCLCLSLFFVFVVPGLNEMRRDLEREFSTFAETFEFKNKYESCGLTLLVELIDGFSRLNCSIGEEIIVGMFFQNNGRRFKHAEQRERKSVIKFMCDHFGQPTILAMAKRDLAPHVFSTVEASIRDDFQ